MSEEDVPADIPRPGDALIAADIETMSPWQFLGRRFPDVELTPAMASLLSQATGTSAQFWLNIQESYDRGAAAVRGTAGVTTGVHVQSAPLEGDILDFGRIRIVRAEWWREAPHFVLLRYTEDGVEAPLGLRMDLDKRIIMDDLEDKALSGQIRAEAHRIWELVTVVLPGPEGHI